MKQKTEKNVKDTEKICKDCKEPLRSNSKYDYCESCRRKRAKKRRDILGIFGGLCLMGLYGKYVKDNKG